MMATYLFSGIERNGDAEVLNAGLFAGG